MKQVDLAAQLDWRLSRSAISYIENGKKCPSIEAMLEIAKALEIEPAALLLHPGLDDRHAAADAILSCEQGGVRCQVHSQCLSCEIRRSRRRDRPLIVGEDVASAVVSLGAST